MKKLIICSILSAAAWVQSASGITLTIDPAFTDATHLVFDLVWTPTAPVHPEVTPLTSQDGHELGAVDLADKLTIVINSGPFASQQDVVFFSVTQREFDIATRTTVSGFAPISVTGPPDGFQARFMFGILDDLPVSRDVPDSGSNLAFLGFAIIGTLPLRKYILRRA